MSIKKIGIPIIFFSLLSILTTGLGIVADIVTVSSFLSLKNAIIIESNIFNTKVGFGYFISIWGIALLLYVAILQSYWEENIKVLSSHNNFICFIIFDIFYFKKPRYFLGFVILALIYILILTLTLDSETKNNFLVFSFVACLFFGHHIYNNPFFSKKYDCEIIKIKNNIDRHWEKIEIRISVELERHTSINFEACRDFDSFYLASISTNHIRFEEYRAEMMQYIFSLYINKYPKKATINTSDNIDTGEIEFELKLVS